MAYRAALEGIVLLENDGVLPLSVGKVALYGAGADMTIKGGTAFADLLLGKVSPSGKLADTWAKRYEDIPFAMEYSYLNGNLEEEYYREDI